MSKRSETATTVGYRLEVAAQLAGLPPWRVRRYLRAGLVRPARAGRVVLFSEAEVARLRKIRRLTEDLGLNLAGVEVVLRLLDEIAVLQAQSAAPARPRATE